MVCLLLYATQTISSERLFHSPSRCKPLSGSPCFSLALNLSHTHIVIHNSQPRLIQPQFSLYRALSTLGTMFGDVRFTVRGNFVIVIYDSLEPPKV